MKRRDFLKMFSAGGLLAALPASTIAQCAPPPSGELAYVIMEEDAALVELSPDPDAFLAQAEKIYHETLLEFLRGEGVDPASGTFKDEDWRKTVVFDMRTSETYDVYRKALTWEPNRA